MIVREAFRDQAKWCDQLGSPLTARVCRLCAERLEPSIPVAATILDWSGDPFAKADSVPLRLAGALHFLARKGSVLSGVYPPHAATDDALWIAIRDALAAHEDVIRAYLAGPPQTNEVMRSAALLPGLLHIATQTGLPLDLYEIGASAGLNLILDRYRYDFGSALWGDPQSPVLIRPEWAGPPPPQPRRLTIRSRRGVDLNPIDLRDPDARSRLLSYVWPDQSERLQRLTSAIELWLRDPPMIERGDAAAWLQQGPIAMPAPRVARVLFHSVTWSYLPDATREQITRLMHSAGESADAQSPLAWLRFELSRDGADLRLTLWPGGADLLLANGHPHGTSITSFLAAGQA